jgi:hypothetical protein
MPSTVSTPNTHQNNNNKNVTSKLSKRNFDKNLKMANIEIMRLRKEV